MGRKIIKIMSLVMTFVLLISMILIPGKRIEAASTIPIIKYQAHVQNKGWLSVVSNDAVAGTTGNALRMEALKITLNKNGKSMINYRTHVSNIGWQGWKTSGQIAGTTGRALAIEAVQIKLTGGYEKNYDIYYRVHVKNIGWMNWVKNGATAGTTGRALRAEAIQIRIVIKSGSSVSPTKPSLTYKSHCQDIGWQNNVKENAVSGTTGKAKRLEALVINLKNSKGNNGVQYCAHVSDIGWQGWKNSGQTAGTTGKAKAIEAIKIKLTGGNENNFDIYYRVHVADMGWLGWAKNGEMAGTTGGAIRAEAIQIKLVNKGTPIDTGGAAYYKIEGTRQIKLQHHMTMSLKQPYSGPCAAYAYGIGLSIVMNRSVDPMQFYRGGYAHYDWGRVNDYTYSFSTYDIYNALKNGKPTMIHYRYTGGQHWVLIMGIRGGANPNKLAYSDFYCIDSALGREVQLTSAYRFNAGGVQGVKIFR